MLHQTLQARRAFAIGAASDGFAFGTLFLNTAVAIVIYFVYSFVLPGLF